MIVKAKIKSLTLDGVQIFNNDIIIGKEYLVELSMKESLWWINKEYNIKRMIDCVPDAMNGGWIPLECLEIVEAINGIQ